MRTYVHLSMLPGTKMRLEHSRDGGVHNTRFAKPFRAQQAGIASAASEARVVGIVAAVRQLKRHVQLPPEPDDIGLRKLDQRGADTNPRAPFHPDLRRQ